MTLSLITGLIIGLGAGAALGYFLGRKSGADAETFAEAMGAKLVHQQADQILRLAETRLAGE